MYTSQFLSEQQLIDVLNSTNVATAIHIGETAVIQTANEAMLRVWGKDKSVIGKSLEDALPELRGQAFAQMFARVWLEGITISGTDTPAEIEVNGVRQMFYFDFEYKAVKSDQGHTIGILHTATDVSERYLSKQREQSLVDELSAANHNLQATNEELAAINEEFAATNEELDDYQQKLQLSNSELLESQSQLQFVIEVAELATWNFDFITERFSGNARLKEWFGVRPEKEISLSDAIAVVNAEERENVLSAIRLAAHDPSYSTYDIEYQIINPISRTPRFVRSKGKVVFDISDRPVRISGTLQDITGQKQREQYKDDFINVASHELKTPVTSLKVSMQILNRMKDNPVPEVLSKMIAQSNKSLDKLTRLVKVLLDSNRISGGQLHLHKTSLVITDLITDYVSHISFESGTRISVQGDKTLRVLADGQQIEQVLGNMIGNALKYAPNSESIEVASIAQGEMVRVSVRDYGPGIAPEKIGFLFERYYRADYSGHQFSGLGLGLYICSEIIKKHGGQIGVQSEPGKGSTFWFTLPLAV